MAKIVTSIRIDDKLWKKVKIHAIENDETVSNMLERLLMKELERRKTESTGDEK